MVRPLRVAYPGALYHVTSRGDRREVIALDDNDRALFLTVLAESLRRFDAMALAYCLMGNHYHLLLQTHEANLSRLMRQLNGVYTQTFNRRHGLTGHLFQGRFRAILVDSDAYLLEVCRYVDLNPVRARMVAAPELYAWSSYRALAGLAPAPGWLDIAQIHTQLAPGKARPAAARRYASFVAQGRDVPLWDELRQQIYLGDDSFIRRMQDQAGLSAPVHRPMHGVCKVHLAAPSHDDDLLHRAAIAVAVSDKAERNACVARAFFDGGHTQTAIAIAFKLSASTVSRVIQASSRANTRRVTGA